MSGTLTITQGRYRKVKVISKSTGNEEIFTIPNNNDYQLILQEDCEVFITNNKVNTTSVRLRTDSNSNINMKVLKMSSSETNINYRFSSNRWLKEFNHSVRDNWNNVTNMTNMFEWCSGLTSIILPNTLPSVTNMSFMFYYCANLTNITLPNELPSVTNMSQMFSGCSNLTTVTLPNGLPNVTYMAAIFSDCTNLTNVTLPNELPNVTNIAVMFANCISFNGNLSNTKFKSSLDKGTGNTAYDYNTPLWLAVNKPQFVL